MDETLKSLWLNDNEIIIYSELLSIWSSVSSTLSARTKINKSTVRYICQGLEKKWLILSIKKDNSFVYSAESPRRLLSLLEEDKRKLKIKEENIEKSIEYFNNLKHHKTNLPKVSFYEWKDWVIELYEKILDRKEPIYSFEDNWEMFKSMPKFVEYFINERKKRKIYNKVICPSNNPVNEESKENLRSVEMIDEKLFPFTWDIKICGNHISIMSFKENNSVGISIEDENIANNFKILFDYIWEKNKKED